MSTVLLAELLSIIACVGCGKYMYHGHCLAKAVSIAFTCLAIGVVLYLNSRAALLSFVCGLFYLLLSGKYSGPQNRLIGIISVTVITSLLFLIRPESAQGRLYIWRVYLDMIKEKPMGFGWNGFIHHYMHYQADYLSIHPDTIFSVLADNVAFPYNEFLHAAISFGIPGLVLLLFLLWNILAFPASFPKDVIIKSLLVNYLVFSFFSYPTDSIYTCLLFPFLILISWKRVLGTCENILCGTIVVVATVLFIKRDTLERKICNECFHYQEQRFDKLLHEDSPGLSLFPELRELIVERIPTEHLTRHSVYVQESARQCPNSESYCRAGDVLAIQGEVQAALSYYEEASRMVPSRLTPRYKAFCLLLNNGQKEEAKAKGNEILSMDLKIRSSEAIQIRNEVEHAMRAFNLID